MEDVFGCVWIKGQCIAFITPMSTTYRLFCSFLHELNALSPIRIDVAASGTVSDVQEVIMQRRRDMFDTTVFEQEVKLWRVDIPVNDPHLANTLLEEVKQRCLSGEHQSLNPAFTLSFVFPKPPAEMCIHLVIGSPRGEKICSLFPITLTYLPLIPYYL
jgi:hypothetical protein